MRRIQLRNGFDRPTRLSFLWRAHSQELHHAGFITTSQPWQSNTGSPISTEFDHQLTTAAYKDWAQSQIGRAGEAHESSIAQG